LIRAFSTILSSVVQSAEHSARALKMAHELIVLLQNDGTLPMTGNIRFSVFGANADNIDMLWGNSDGFNIQGTKTIFEGLRSIGIIVIIMIIIIVNAVTVIFCLAVLLSFALPFASYIGTSKSVSSGGF
jgi:beta-glucosidase-like glycosyl hydrolase